MKTSVCTKAKKALAAVRRVLTRRGGLSMVSLIVAFAIFMIIIPVWTQCCILALNLIGRADNIRDASYAAIEDYYINAQAGADTLVGGGKLRFVSDAGGFEADLGAYCYTPEENGVPVYWFDTVGSGGE